jgi:peroxin-4
MSSSAVKRLRKELTALQKSPDPDIILKPVGDDIRKWTALMRGPEDTPFEGGVFELSIQVDVQYPLTPPSIRFVTPVFHPNIRFSSGEICVDLLRLNSWTPAWSLLSACRAIMTLLSHPEADSPLNCDAGNMIRHGDMRAYQSITKLYVMEYAQRSWPQG